MKAKFYGWITESKPFNHVEFSYDYYKKLYETDTEYIERLTDIINRKDLPIINLKKEDVFLEEGNITYELQKGDKLVLRDHDCSIVDKKFDINTNALCYFTDFVVKNIDVSQTEVDESLKRTRDVAQEFLNKFNERIRKKN